MIRNWPRLLAPTGVGVGFLLLWEALVRAFHVPFYIVPSPLLVVHTLVQDAPLLLGSLLVTLHITALALLLAVTVGVLVAFLFVQSRLIEMSLFPYAVLLQVTPIVAIAPLLLIYLSPQNAVLVCAFLVAFFPILSNTALGLASVDHGLLDLFDLYRASAWDRLIYLRAPAALPQFLTGLRIAGGLALIGAVVAELAAGAAGQGTGLAFRIVEAGFRLDIPRMFGALALLSLAGMAIYGALSLLSSLALKDWHESARERGA